MDGRAIGFAPSSGMEAVRSLIAANIDAGASGCRLVAAPRCNTGASTAIPARGRSYTPYSV